MIVRIDMEEGGIFAVAATPLEVIHAPGPTIAAAENSCSWILTGSG